MGQKGFRKVKCEKVLICEELNDFFEYMYPK